MKTKRTAVRLSHQKRKATLKARRPAHKKFLLHPATVFFLLCIGVLLLGWTLRAGAISYSVKAKVAAAPLTEPASITSPSDGDIFKTKPINVAGACPSDSYVKILRNSEFAGVALCDNATKTYALQVDLVPGSNQLESHVFNITDDEGPLPLPINVIYQPPSPAEPSPQPQPSPQPTLAPLLITGDYSYKGCSVGSEASWKITISGGKAPYAVHVIWGDGQDDTYSTANGELTISHVYKTAGNYEIKINAVDSGSNQSYLQLAAVVTDRAGTLQVIGNNQSPISKIAGSAQSWLWMAWPAYATLMLMVLSYYLGERTELAHMKAAGRRKNRP